MIIDFKDKSQITIPAKIVRNMKLKPGDKLEIQEQNGHLVLTPVVIVPRDQKWFYSEEWQAGEAEADRQIAQGDVFITESKEELFKGLGLDE
jgi:antitoxin MazE